MSEEGQNCIALWRAVIDRGFSDLNPPKNRNWQVWGKEHNNFCVADINTYWRVLKWLKTKDFEIVCDLADLNIEYTREYLMKHALNTYNLMPENLQQKIKGVFE